MNRTLSLSPTRLYALLTALTLALALPIAAQEELPGALTETIDVRVVNVEVVVTDRQGNRVHGLPAEEFRLLVDGEEVPVEYFNEIRGGVAVETDAASRTEIPSIAPGKPMGTSYLVFVDEFFTLPTDRRQVLRSLQEDLAFLAPEDRMAIVAWDGKRLAMLSSWSTSQVALHDTVEEAMQRPAYGLQRYSERRQLDRALRSRLSFSSFDAGRLDVEERAYLARFTDQLEKGVSAATATLRSFAQPPGRKVMLLVSGGWPFQPVDFVDGTPQGAIFDRSLYRGGERLYGPLAETANLLGYTLYPVDAPGLEESSHADASLDFRGIRELTDLNYYQELELHSSLRYLADATGGQAMINGLRAQALERAHGDTRSFYWLGFSPSRQHDDAWRRVEVELRRPGLRLRSRDGYADLSKQSEVAMAVESSLLFGHPAGTGSLVMELGQPQPAGRGKMELPVVIRIPADEITLLPVGENEYVAQLELQIAAIDERGNRSEITSLPFVVRRQALPAPGEAIDYETTLKMRRRPQELVVAVYDSGSDVLLSAAAEIGP